MIGLDREMTPAQLWALDDAGVEEVVWAFHEFRWFPVMDDTGDLVVLILPDGRLNTIDAYKVTGVFIEFGHD